MQVRYDGTPSGTEQVTLLDGHPIVHGPLVSTDDAVSGSTQDSQCVKKNAPCRKAGGGQAALITAALLAMPVSMLAAVTDLRFAGQPLALQAHEYWLALAVIAVLGVASEDC